MKPLLRNRVVQIWLLLIVITIASWLTARDGGSDHQLDAIVTIVVLLIAAVKAELVIWHFMEVDRSPKWLRVTTAGWVAGTFTALLGLYFATS